MKIILAIIATAMIVQAAQARSLDRQIVYHFEDQAGQSVLATLDARLYEHFALEFAKKTGAVHRVRRCVDFGVMTVARCATIWQR